jgi:hypothetical protein
MARDEESAKSLLLSTTPSYGTGRDVGLGVQSGINDQRHYRGEVEVVGYK